MTPAYYEYTRSWQISDARLLRLAVNVLRASSARRYSHILVNGDFHYPKIDWDNWTAHGNEKSLNFIKCLRDCYFNQLITKPTRGRGNNNPSILDLVITNDDDFIETCNTFSPLGKSDHFVVEVVFKCERKSKSEIPSLKRTDVKLAESSKEKADTLSEFFASVFTSEPPGTWTPKNKPNIVNSLSITITEKMVYDKLCNLNISKSPGPDNMHPRVLKELADVLTPAITEIFNNSLRSATVPENWKYANISAIFKKGDKNLPTNYRPVSLTSILCKILESFIKDALVKFLVDNGLLSNKQYEFISGRSTVLQLIKVLDKWTEILDRGGAVDEVQYSDIFLFADDNKLFREIFSSKDSRKLQEDLNSIVQWSNNTLLKFNPDKCVAMRITTKNRLSSPCNYVMNGSALRNTSCEEDLGVLIDNHLTFSNHISLKVKKANQIMGLIRRTFDYMDNENFVLLFTSLVRPHIEYANTVWCTFLKKDMLIVENVQRRATKMLPGMKDLTYDERLRLLKLPSLFYRRYRADMIETFKITNNVYDEAVTENLLLPKLSNTRGHDKALFKRSCNLDLRKFSFTNRVVTLWNSLPEDTVSCNTVNQFKMKLDKLWSDKD
ncbi:uncharacterized protein LOC130648032 [Hydractinia symbiolongicarpus]|uniref:uncharacterized protein LOC130648032 n=1 Tax=Hydractinia symbiolongicarpus TaxID=13093 RepID=UPI00254C8178|nr:uncharacterized protein LOC130648032 [Hydractinia symbiolongicarpus]